ncbi:MAG: hypothetical protein OEQ53_21170 [Saprospiraceae bacterium]|nr:hypothetical protein [Saprospiraceae bacterium]
MRLLSTFILTLTLSILNAQETGLKDFPNLGISFTIPEGWVGQVSDAGYVMGSYTEPGILMAMSHETKDLNQLKTEAAAGMADQQGTQLVLEGDVADFGSDGIAANYVGSIAWQPAKAFAVSIINPHGYGATLIYMTTSEMFKEEAIALVKKTAQTFSFKKVATPAPVAHHTGDPNLDWQGKFQNARLTYMNSYYSSGGSYGGYSTGGGYSDKEIIDLCGQGYFKYFSSSSMSMDTGGAFGSSNSSDKGAGTWRIANSSQGKVLELNFHNGQSKQYVLSSEEGKTFLNGTRYYCTYGTITDDGPDCF